MIRPSHPRFTDADGRVWVTRSVVGCRKIPGFRAVDELTVPFLRRSSVQRRIGAAIEAAEAAWRRTMWATWEGTLAEADAAQDAIAARVDRLRTLAARGRP